MSMPPDESAPHWPASPYPSSSHPAGEISASEQPGWIAPTADPPALPAQPPPPGAYPPPAYPLPPATVQLWPAHPPLPYGYLPPPYFQPPIADPGSDAAVASLILGIVSAFVTFLVFVPCLPLIGLGAAIAGIITGALGLKSTTRHGMAVGGLVTSVVALALGVGMIVGYIIIEAIMLSGMPSPA